MPTLSPTSLMQTAVAEYVYGRMYKLPRKYERIAQRIRKAENVSLQTGAWARAQLTRAHRDRNKPGTKCWHVWRALGGSDGFRLFSEAHIKSLIVDDMRGYDWYGIASSAYKDLHNEYVRMSALSSIPTRIANVPLLIGHDARLPVGKVLATKAVLNGKYLLVGGSIDNVDVMSSLRWANGKLAMSIGFYGARDSNNTFTRISLKEISILPVGYEANEDTMFIVSDVL